MSRAHRVPRDPVGEIVIVRRDPRLAFRVVENQMNYSYLGDRLKTAAAENFPIFLADLCARADDAYLPPSTRALLNGATCRNTNSPRPRPFSTTQRIACSGAGTVATARPMAWNPSHATRTQATKRRDPAIHWLASMPDTDWNRVRSA